MASRDLQTSGPAAPPLSPGGPATLQEANRCIRDLIALSTLPSVWLGAEPLRIAESLLAAVDRTIGPQLGYIRIQGEPGSRGIELAQRQGVVLPDDQVAELGQRFAAWAAGHDPEDLLELALGGSRPLHVCVYPLGSDLDAGLLAAGFTDPGAATGFNRILLNLAANQAVVACQNSALHRKQAMLYEQAAREIIERQQAEALLRESEARFRTAFENAAMGIALVSLDGRFLRVNEAMGFITGYPAAELIGKTFAEITQADHVDENQEGARRLAAGAIATYAAEKRYRRKNGSLVWVSVTVSLLRNPDGKPQSFITLVEDIDERKRKEATLQFLVELNASAQQLTDPAQIMAVTAETLGRHLVVDRCAYAEVEDETVFVITGDYLRGVRSIVGRWPVAAFGRECTRLMRANQSYVVTDVDGDARITPEDIPAYRATNIQAVICVPLHKEGRFIAAMAVHQTVPRQWTREETDLVELVVARCWESLERARALRSLRESEQRLRFMAESMPQKIFSARPTGEIDYVNRQWLDFTGLTAERLRELGWAKLVHPNEAEENERRWAHSLATGEPFEMERRFMSHDGAYRWHLSRAQAMRDGSGSILMWIGSDTDITEIVEARETLAGRGEELERLVSERTASLREAIEQMEEFSYSVSHDLRAPLRSIQGYAQVLLTDFADKVGDEGTEYLRRIVSAGTRMDRLTLDVLTYSRVARAAVHPERVRLDVVVRECVQHLGAAERAEIETSTPLHDVMGHESLLTQAISNLLGNAMKFVPPGTRPRIRIESELRDGQVRLSLIDNGIGVEPEQQKRIWGMFERLHGTARYEGTGIGLAIVRKAVERMGGTVGVISDGRNGSRFWIQLPSAA